MRLLVPLLFIILFILVTDLYLYKALRLSVKNISDKKIRRLLFITHWSIPLISITIYLFISSRLSAIRDPSYYSWLFNSFGIFIMIYFPKLIVVCFHLLEDIVFLIIRYRKKGFKRFLFITKTGFLLSLIPVFLILYGMIWGKYNFIIRNEKLKFSSLPVSFNNLKIVQFSDMHLGSFGSDKKTMDQVTRLVNDQEADIILFTGDMVNNFAEEMNGFENALAGMKSKYGKWAIMGNHDYGDYYKWPDEKEKTLNKKIFLKKLTETGFRVLLNQSDSLTINGESIAIIGVENWGKPPFKQYGDIEKACAGTERFRFKILLSHDPDYWRTSIINKTDIDLTLSGHTHGMQIGWEWRGKRYSPSKIRFKEWGGLYREGNQFLYVNTGTGFIGLPARIGMPPEITVIILKRD